MKSFAYRVVGVALALCALLIVGRIPAADAQAPAQEIIRAIDIQGYEHVEQPVRDLVQKSLKSQIGQLFDADTAAADVETILQTGWFFRADYRKEPLNDGVRLIFVVVENPIITRIEFIGNTKLSTEQLLRVIKTKPNQVLNRDLGIAGRARNQKGLCRPGLYAGYRDEHQHHPGGRAAIHHLRAEDR